MAPRVVVHVPHASTVIPEDVAPTLMLTPQELETELVAMTDWFTDELFALAPALACTVRFPVSRLVVDPERFTNDEQEPMASQGMGVVYTHTSHGRPLRRATSATERSALLARYYDPHHRALTTAVSAAVDAHGSCFIVDGHSFLSTPLPYEPDQRTARPEVCIGTDPHHTPTWLRDVAVAAFGRAGFQIEVDRPFAGALVPMTFYRRDARVTALMVEVNRSLYLDEMTARRTDGFAEVRRRICHALKELIESSPPHRAKP